MKKYRVEFELRGLDYGTEIEAESEYHARIKLINKTQNKAVVTSCKEINPFEDSNSILRLLLGFRK